MLNIIYQSRTGNCKQIALALSASAKSIEGLTLNEPSLLITYTDGLGKIPKATKSFLKKQSHHVKYLVVSGESRFKKWAFLAGDKIIKKYPHITLLKKIEKAGNESEIHDLKKMIEQLS